MGRGERDRQESTSSSEWGLFEKNLESGLWSCYGVLGSYITILPEACVCSTVVRYITIYRTGWLMRWRCSQFSMEMEKSGLIWHLHKLYGTTMRKPIQIHYVYSTLRPEVYVGIYDIEKVMYESIGFQRIKETWNWIKEQTRPNKDSTSTVTIYTAYIIPDPWSVYRGSRRYLQESVLCTISSPQSSVSLINTQCRSQGIYSAVYVCVVCVRWSSS